MPNLSIQGAKKEEEFSFIQRLLYNLVSMQRTTLIVGLSALLLTACAGKEDATVGTNEDEWTSKMEVAMPGAGGVVDQNHGKEIWFAIAPMSGSNDVPANGVTQAHYFEDGTYLHNLKVNIARSEDGFFYEGWVVSDDGEDWESLGHLQSHFADARHGVQFRGTQDVRKYLNVRVTLEQDDGDPSPGKIVAEGRLKVTPR
jgi:hypothetical protein